jgi:hypothetical protein
MGREVLAVSLHLTYLFFIKYWKYVNASLSLYSSNALKIGRRAIINENDSDQIIVEM